MALPAVALPAVALVLWVENPLFGVRALDASVLLEKALVRRNVRARGG